MGIDLAAAARDYLALRRSLGFKLVHHQRLIGEFIAWLHGHGHDWSVDAIVEWACLPAVGPGPWWAQRLRAVRGFAAYLQVLDPTIPVPPAGLIGPQTSRAEPFIYTVDEIARLLGAVAANNRDAHLRSTFQTMFALMAVTAMRVGEVRGLDDDDIDATAGVITIRDSKFAKTREIPVHPSTIAALVKHQRLRRRTITTVTTPAVFMSSRGNRIDKSLVQRAWTRAVRRAQIVPRSARCRPRMHDLRHTFAVMTLERWLAEGADVDRMLPRLSTYLGHNNPISTYWYLTATPTLLRQAAARLEAVTT